MPAGTSTGRLSEINQGSLCLWRDPAVPSVPPALRWCRCQSAPSRWRSAGFFQYSGRRYSATPCPGAAELSGTAAVSKPGGQKSVIDGARCQYVLPIVFDTRNCVMRISRSARGRKIQLDVHIQAKKAYFYSLGRTNCTSQAHSRFAGFALNKGRGGFLLLRY